jgi:hypothetical protein
MLDRGAPSKTERLRNVQANLARVYHPEPLKLSEWMKEQIRRLKSEADESEEPRRH